MAAGTIQEKFIRLTLVIACAAAGAVIVWLVGISPFMPFSRIILTPIEGFTREDILEFAGISPSASFVSLDAAAVEKLLEAIPQIEKARVYKHFPDRLEIVIDERRAVAVTFVHSNDKTVPVFIDANGVIFYVSSEIERSAHTLPVISGYFIENPVLGSSLLPVYIPFLKELESLKLRVPELLSAISEIKINQKDLGFDFIIYPVYPQIRVSLSEINEDILKYTLLMVDVLSARDMGIDFIDFRSGMASFIPGSRGAF